MTTGLPNKRSVIFIIFLGILAGCKHSSTEFAAKWTNDIKAKIKEDASQTPDRTLVDSVHHQITLFKGDKKLRQYYLAERENFDERTGKIYDTGMIIYYSTDQNFQLIRQPCIPKAERTYEGVAYKGNRFGMAEYVYCHQPLRLTGFHYNNLNVASWIKVDSTGKVIEKIDAGNEDKLDQLEAIKYAR